MFSRLTKKIRILSTIKSYMWETDSSIRLRTILSSFLTVGSAVLNAFAPLILKKSIDILIEPNNKVEFFGNKIDPETMMIIYGIVWTGGQATSYLRAIAVTPIIYHANKELSQKLINHINTLSVPYRKKQTTGELMENVMKAQNGVRDLIYNGFINVLPITLEIALATGYIAKNYGSYYGIGTLGMLGVYSIFTIKGTDWSEAAKRHSDEISSEAASRIVDTLLNYDTVEYFTNIKYELLACSMKLNLQENAAVESEKSANLILIGQSIILGIGMTILINNYIQEVLADRHKISDFILFTNYLLEFAFPLNALGYFIRDIKNALIDLESVMDILDTKPDIYDHLQAVPIPKNNLNVIFDNVSFKYPDGSVILKNISFKISPGSKLGIVGDTGSGKSTIAKLLFRSYDVSTGRILVGNKDIREITLESLHSAIGIVPRQPEIFNDTLYHNVHYGNFSASKAEVELAMKNAQLTSIMNDSERNDSLLGERGVMLSDGEKQRIGIARNILKNPAICVFDEATSALDAKTESLIEQMLKKTITHKTQLVIAHRLSLVKDADEIIFLENGRVVERGTHDFLLKKNGKYSNLWNKQSNQQKPLKKKSMHSAKNHFAFYTSPKNTMKPENMSETLTTNYHKC